MPPPPKLSFMEEAAFEPGPDLAQGPRSDAEVPAELSVDIEIDAAAKPVAPAEPEIPQARRGVLPPPKSDGKRVQPLATRGQRTHDAPKRPSASGLPSGMRAPGVPQETEAENTDILIASAVAALTEGETDGDLADNSSMLLTADPPHAAATSAIVLPPPPAGATPAPEARKRGGFLWFGVAALAALTALAIVFSGGDDDEPEETSTAGAVAQADKQPANPANEPAAAAQSAIASPQLPPLALDVPSDVGGAWIEIEDTTDVGDGLATAHDLGSIEVVGDEPQDEDGVDEASAVANAKPKSGRGKRRRKPKEPATSRPRPTPAAPAKPPPDAATDAATLLADARKALAAGQARKAYTLASKSRNAKRTSAALVVMTKAACRLGRESQAKSAFNQLSVTHRRGLRAECRNRGVRLGL